MKLRWYDRVLVALSGLVLMALGACVILAAGGVIALPEPIAFDTWLGDGWQWMPLIFLAGALLVIWGLFLFLRPFHRGEERGKYYTLQSEDDGNVRISVGAIDHLVRRAIDAYDQVLTAKVKIGGQEDAMQVTLHLTLVSDVRIPELVEMLREDIKASLKRGAGVTVAVVQVYIDATRDEKGDGVRKLPAPPAEDAQAPREVVNAVVFSKMPAAPEAAAPAQAPQYEAEPTVAELEKEIDFGPDEPLPVTLSGQAFPFPEEEAGVPLTIYTHDVPPDEDPDEEDADDDR